jgi:hypothetical protein
VIIAHAISASLLGISVKTADTASLAASGVYGSDVSEMAFRVFARGLQLNR